MLPKAKVQNGARYLLGMIFLVFGLNGFFNFLPMPPMPEKAGAFLGGLAAAQYFFPVLKATEVLCGLSLLSGWYASLALVVLAPISLQIFLFHAFLTPEAKNWVFPVLILVLHGLSAKIYWAKYKPLLQKK